MSLLVVVLSVLVAPAGNANLQERITLRKGPPVERDYGPLVPGDPFSFPTPGACSSSPYCDTIPLTVIVPKLGATEDFFVRITLSWDTSTNANLLLYIWNDPPESDPEGQRLIAQSGGEEEPKEAILYRPEEGKYFVTVLNPAGTAPGNVPAPSGPNTAYNLRVEMTFRSFDSPFESLESPPSAPESSPSGTVTDSTLPPSRFSEPGRTPLTLAPLRPDQEFDNLAGRASALDSLEVQAGPLVAQPSAARPPPGPVNGFLLALWAGIVPVGVVAAGAVFLRRRAAASLDLS